MVGRSIFDVRKDEGNPGATTILTVACVLSRGRGGYDRSHVERLASMVAQHMHQPYKFVCVDDSPYPGFWAKLSLFQPGRFSGRVLSLDLDVTVKGQLDELANHQSPFIICKDWFRMGFNSSVMAWNASAADRLFTEFDFARDAPNFRGGDQAWVFHKMPDADKFPACWVQSFKAACMRGRFEQDLRVIAFHGFPRPWELEEFS